MRNRLLLALVLLWAGVPAAAFGTPARVPPPPPVEPERPALARAPERPRRPVELVPEATLGLSSCAGGAGSERCRALGPAFGAGLLVLHRPTPYFAFGGALAYASSHGTSTPNGEAGAVAVPAGVSSQSFGLSLAGRVYLLEAGDFEPYLELAFGYASLRMVFVAAPGVESEDAAFGPSLRAGGGVDAIVAEGLRLGVGAAYSELVFGSGERCANGRCAAQRPGGGTISGGLVGSLRVTLLFGEPL